MHCTAVERVFTRKGHKYETVKFFWTIAECCYIFKNMLKHSAGSENIIESEQGKMIP
jgi:hypothetical protein